MGCQTIEWQPPPGVVCIRRIGLSSLEWDERGLDTNMI
jgi:hypothetical protein